MSSKQPQMIPADQSTAISSTATVREPHSDKWVIAEHPSVSPLPGGLIIKTCVVMLGEKSSCHLSVVISNTTAHDVTIPPWCIVAELKAIQSVLPKEKSNRSVPEPIPAENPSSIIRSAVPRF